MPFVFVDICADERWQRVKGAIDTGSTRTLVTLSAVQPCDAAAQINRNAQCDFVALGGTPIHVLGEICLELKRDDGPVSLPTIDVTAVVVPDLDVVAADVLLGSDLVAASGGLQLWYDDSTLSAVRFGATPTAAPATVASVSQSATTSVHPSKHVTTEYTADGVTFGADDGTVAWNGSSWELRWNWKNGQPPTQPVGSGLGQYNRSNLTPEQEVKFNDEVESWIANGWLVEHSSEIHGEPAAVLPIMAVEEEHKESTPIRPVLDYRQLNKLIVSHPGNDAAVCQDTFRNWRASDDDADYSLLDIRKAYLQVKVAPELLRYQVVLWKEKKYVMTRMGFGLAVAPKFMDIVVKWETRDYPEVGNYVDDLRVPSSDTDAVSDVLLSYGLPTKEAENMESARVLGLQ
eukprot:scpid27783/ scgid19383/ 